MRYEGLLLMFPEALRQLLAAIVQYTHEVVISDIMWAFSRMLSSSLAAAAAERLATVFGCYHERGSFSRIEGSSLRKSGRVGSAVRQICYLIAEV